MKLEYPQPKPIDDGEYGVLVSKGYGTPTGDICLDGGKWEMTLARVSAEDCDRLIKAAAEIKSRILDYRAEMTAPHGTKHFYKGRCQLCGKPEDDELHAEVITDSERDCTEQNPVTGAWCYKNGAHTQHFDPDGGTWTTDLPPYASPRPGDRCKCGHVASSHHLNLVAGEFQYCNGCAGVDDCAVFSPAEPVSVAR